MYLDERSNQIFKEILGNPEVSNAELENKYELSRRQISYSFTKINDWLEENNYPAIKRTKSGKFVLNPVLLELLVEKPAHSQTTYILSEHERAILILLMILSAKEELSLIHFSSALKVSKNTILRDLKNVNKMVELYDLEVIYSRLEGYTVSGEEWNKRRLLISVLKRTLDIYKGKTYIYQFSHVKEETIRQLSKQVEEVENRLSIQFSDERARILPYIIALILNRIESGYLLSGSYHIDYQELSDTKEYEAAELFIQNAATPVPHEERLFITLQLLTSNILSAQFLTNKEIPQLRTALQECLLMFEKQAILTLKDKEKLLEKLVLHMKPAYYRIKYRLTTNYSMIEKVGEEFEAIHYIVKNSIKPFEEYLGEPVPESEIMFMTIFIGGHLISSGESIPKRKKAVVVCPNGVSISNLMNNTLRGLFPEFFFHPPLSLREFKQLKEDYDLIFSPIPLQTSKQLFIVHHVLSEFEKLQLRQRVMKEVFDLQTPSFNMEQLIETIGKHASIKDRKQLEKALETYFTTSTFTDPASSTTKQDRDYVLSDFINPETIVLEEDVDNWHEALEKASQPLLEKGLITAQYIETMKQQYPSVSPHILLRMNIAIPHASPEDGVNALGMSLLKIKNGLPIGGGKRIYFVTVIAAVDKDKHLGALLQLMRLAEKREVLDQMIHLNTKQEMYELIQAHSS
ncbi:BglG family transcription antiterminator [Domibacillus indicus]|uniref:BglG family transcription antiterminator n=1 Tax=Domibacillus indicus TaxID=1437523 RepID=UPI00203F8E65|nr:BglG family transcription antiterminator [Domibacillus indicus]MCM3790677.1 BglG family transcription antiterminator [Domibacillus indicus]